jgi:acyl-CoA thioesterase YciA
MELTQMKYTTRKLVMSGDLNTNNSLFGGRALAWIDEAAAIHALEELHHPKCIVTKHMSNLDFMAPGKLGDIIEIGTETAKIGTTSITVSCVLRNMTTQKEIVKVDEVVFVNVNEDGKPVAHGIESY